jgi:uncharacterized protein YhfF
MVNMEHTQEDLINVYWRSFLLSVPPDTEKLPERYQAWGFGNTPEMADELGELVQKGIKTATASLLWTFEEEGEDLPQIGDYSIILNGQGKPLCIIQTTAIDIVPFDEVGEEQAYLEGEGDRSLPYWQEVHWKFFSEECTKIDKKPSESMPVVCERFTLVHIEGE